MYLIFKPSKDKKAIENIGLNDAVPQATGAGMPDDKGKAYEQEMLERKEQENAMLWHAFDYWNTEDKQEPTEKFTEEMKKATAMVVVAEIQEETAILH
jgi:hypothetical protein